MAGIIPPGAVEGVASQQELSQFANAVSAQTGVDPRVVASWGELETGGTPLGHNWLNLRPYPGDPYVGVSPGGFEEYANVQDAIAATVRRINQPFATPIRVARGHTPREQIAAIASTGWDAGHYGGAGGPHLVDEFVHLYGEQALASKGSSKPITGVNTSGNTQPGSVPLGGVFHAVGSALSFPERAFNYLTSWRFLELLGGALLLLLGFYLLGRQFGVTPGVRVAAAEPLVVGNPLANRSASSNAARQGEAQAVRHYERRAAREAKVSELRRAEPSAQNRSQPGDFFEATEAA